MNQLKPYTSNQSNEVIIVDDGSNDGTQSILKKTPFIKLIRINKNTGKGSAVKMGLKTAKNDKIVIFDGDMEIPPKMISQLMLLDNKVKLVLGSRYSTIPFRLSSWDFGNFIITKIFNIIHNSNVKDSLCCAKAFFKTDLEPYSLLSSKFEIDVELTACLLKNIKQFKTVYLSYDRRLKSEGKKLSYQDGLNIFIRILRTKYFIGYGRP